MAISMSPVRWVAGLGAAVAVGSAVLVPGLAGAQTPPRGTNEPSVTIRCADGGPATGARPADGAIRYSAAVFATTNEDFAAELAGALGVSTAQVERALASSQPEAPPVGEDAPTFSVVGVTNDPDVLEAVAGELDVSVADLEAAVEAAMPDAPDCETGSSEGDGPLVFIGGNADVFEAIAEELGNGIAGEDVQSAFEAALPQVAPPGVAARPALMFDVDALAEALGINVEELREAMESIMPLPRR